MRLTPEDRFAVVFLLDMISERESSEKVQEHVLYMFVFPGRLIQSCDSIGGGSNSLLLLPLAFQFF